jgi:hypothetical protein
MFPNHNVLPRAMVGQRDCRHGEGSRGTDRVHVLSLQALHSRNRDTSGTVALE